MILYGEASLLERLLPYIKVPIEGYFGEQAYLGLPLPYLGPYQETIFPGKPVLLAFEDNTTRRNLAQRLRHPLASPIVASSYEKPKQVGASAILLGVVAASAQIGALVLVEEQAQVGPHVRIGPFSFIGKGALLESGAYLGASVYVAPKAVVCAGIKIGDGAIVAPGALVASDVPPFTYVQGSPAKPCPPSLP